MSKSWDQNQDGHLFGSDLCPNCLQKNISRLQNSPLARSQNLQTKKHVQNNYECIDLSHNLSLKMSSPTHRYSHLINALIALRRQNILLGTRPECQTAWIQIRPDILSSLIWVQTICKRLSADDNEEMMIKNT